MCVGELDLSAGPATAWGETLDSLPSLPEASRRDMQNRLPGACTPALPGTSTSTLRGCPSSDLPSWVAPAGHCLPLPWQSSVSGAWWARRLHTPWLLHLLGLRGAPRRTTAGLSLQHLCSRVGQTPRTDIACFLGGAAQALPAAPGPGQKGLV